MEQDKTVSFQPGELGQSDRISYESSDTHARDYCCCIHGWGTGPDPRWYYPWDKGIYRLIGVCCMWYCICAIFPCALCFKESRDIICCADQCGNKTKTSATDDSKDEEIAEA